MITINILVHWTSILGPRELSCGVWSYSAGRSLEASFKANALNHYPFAVSSSGVLVVVIMALGRACDLFFQWPWFLDDLGSCKKTETVWLADSQGMFVMLKYQWFHGLKVWVVFCPLPRSPCTWRPGPPFRVSHSSWKLATFLLSPWQTMCLECASPQDFHL